MSITHATPTFIKYIFGLIMLAAVFNFLPINLYRDLPHINTSDLNNDKDRTDYYMVTRVVDGDTIVIDINGVQEKVRLIGINSPESVDPRRNFECYGIEASKYMKSIANGQYVQLEYDSSQDKRDKYDRLLAYLYLQDGQMLNKKMIADGYAYEYTYNKPYKYQKEFKAAQSIATYSDRGLWAAETCAGKK